MPKLELCGLKLGLSSDDFVISSFIGIIYRIGITAIQTGLLVSEITKPSQCTAEHHIKVFLIVYICFNVCYNLVYGLLCHESSKGSVFQESKRKHVPKLLIVCILLFIAEIVLVGVGIYFLLPTANEGCKETTNILCWVILGISLISIIVTIIGFLIVWDMSSRISSSVDPAEHNNRWWQTRCRFIFCCYKKQADSDISDIAFLLTKLFEDVDLTFSDVLIGLELLRRQHRELSGLPVEGETMRTVQLEESRLSDIVRFSHFARAMYGFPMFVLEKSCTGCMSLTSDCLCCRTQESIVISDGGGCCSWNLSAVIRTAEISQQDIHYLSFSNTVDMKPFMVCYDSRKNAIIVSIRGTLSMADALTDMSACAISLNEDAECSHLPHDSCAHKGMTKAAKSIASQLLDFGLLDSAFIKNPTAQLIIVGHSLGAGTAGILAALLKGKYPDLTCYCYAPPGGLMSHSLTQYCRSFVWSIVFGKDVVPRLSIPSIYELKKNLIDQLLHSHTPKYRILLSPFSRFFLKTFCCFKTDDSQDVANTAASSNSSTIHLLDNDNDIDNYLTGNVEPCNSPVRVTLSRLRSNLEVTRKASLASLKMFPPGVLIHIQDIRDEAQRKATKNKPHPSHFRVFEIQQQAAGVGETDFARLDYGEIILCREMFSDHMPHKLSTVLELMHSVYTVQD